MPVSREEFDQVAATQRRTSQTLIAEVAVLMAEVTEVKALLRRVARHLGIDPNGSER